MIQKPTEHSGKDDSMNSNRQFKVVLHSFPSLKEVYPFMRRGARAASNKNLAGKEVEKFISALEKNVIALSSNNMGTTLEEYLEKMFSTSVPSDKLLHLAEDAIALALIRFLYSVRHESDKPKYTAYAVCYMSALENIDFETLYLRYSSVEKILEKRNFLSFCDCDKESKDHIRRSVYIFAKKHRIPDKEGARLIDEQFLEKRQKKITKTYTAALWILPLLFSIAVLYFCGFFPMVFLILPIITFSSEAICTIASFIQPPAPILKLKKQPIEHPVLVTVTILLTSEKELSVLCKRLKKMLLQNPEEGITFALLADFPESLHPHDPKDDALEMAAVNAIEALNKEYPGRFGLFLRDRVKSTTQNRYMGWERKRGALLELVRLIKGKPTTFRKVIAKEELLKKTAYILTLDADTDLSIGAVSRLYSTMRHPANKPVIKDGVVVQGYGVLQPRMVTDIKSAGKTPFAMMMSGGGGTDSYENAVFDFYQTVFGKGAFCGKGIFDVEVFHEVLEEAFPEGRILSHDLLEGTRLRCGYLSEMALTDTCPATALSFYNRQHRWLRGDFQALPFAFKFLPFRGIGKKVKNPIDRLSKYMIISNVTRALTPVFALAALFFSTLLKESTCVVFLLFSFAYLLFPLLCTILQTIRFVGRRFYSTVIQNVWQGIFRTGWALCSLCYNAQLSLDAGIRVLYRSAFSKKNLLEWTTAGESERKYSKGSFGQKMILYFLKALPSLVIAAFMLIFSVGGVVRLLSLSFLLFPFFALCISLPYRKKKSTDPAVQKELINYAKESFLFFERFVTAKDHYLPPDNYQEHPVAVLARRTSPTNIALYLTSVVSMADLGVMPNETMLEKLEQTCDTLMKLPKYRGHLYNWYTTDTLDILGAPYISTVDSGNLAVALVCLCQALKEQKSPRAKHLLDQFGKLLSDMDFSFLYNERKGLLCIGYDPIEEKHGEHCYDLLASEARSAYFYAIATRQIPISSWARLGRPVTVRDGHMGILAFSGTAFEFFMPALFLPLYENTLLYEALCFALFEQERDRVKGVWGRSESCYFAFDERMNYQYRAFGSGALALDPTVRKEQVIAPYASFLALCLSPRLVLENLRKMAQRGLHGNCGFYEAADFTSCRVGKGVAVIRSYMSHHVGMSITAIANACCDSIFVRRFLADSRMDATTELLKERIPSDAPISKISLSQPSFKTPALPFFSLPQTVKTPFKFHADMALLYSGSAAVCASGDGTISFRFGKMLLTPPPGSLQKAELSVLSNKMCVPLSLAKRFYFDGKKLGYAYEDKLLSFQVSVFAVEKEGWLIHGSVRSKSERGALLFSSPLTFCTSEEFITHPAYAGLSVESKYFEKDQILLFKKRSRTDSEASIYLAVALVKKTHFSFLTREDDLHYVIKEEQTPLPCVCGPARKPFLQIKIPFENQKDFNADILLLVCRSKEEAFAKILDLRRKNEKKPLQKLYSSNSKFSFYGQFECPERVLLDYASLLLQGIYKERSLTAPATCFPIGQLWRYGISGDDPIFSFFLSEKALSESQKKMIVLFLRAHALLAEGGVHCDLILARKEKEQYFSPAKKELEQLVTESVGKSRVSRKGGIHLIFDADAASFLPSFSKVCLFIEKDCIFQSLRKQFLSQLVTDQPSVSKALCSKEPSNNQVLCTLPCGDFTEKGFIPLKNRFPYSPYSMIYCSHQFGTLLTEKSLGFTWFRNSGELRLTPFSGQEQQESLGEQLLLHFEGQSFDLCASASSVRFEKSCAVYTGHFGSISFGLQVGVDEKFPVKILLLTIQNLSPTEQTVAVEYRIKPAFHKTADGKITEKRSGETRFFKRTVSYGEPDFGIYLSSSAEAAVLSPGESRPFFWLLGTVNLKNDKCFYTVREKFKEPKDLINAFERYQQHYEQLLSSCRFHTGSKGQDLLLDYYIPYQVLTARLYGRTGFFQPGGAYGFRDQLQDALSMLFYDPEILRNQLYRSACHQYTEGDVQHWWHKITAREDLSDAGIRSECSDDFLWLPYAYAKYLDATGDTDIAEKKISYLSSSPLLKGDERYERPQRTERKESLYFHCVRAIDLALARRGGRGLCKMGSCDWNDGLSSVRGESVWLTQFLFITLRAFLPHAQKEEKERYEKNLRELESILDICYEDGQYLRAFFEDGTPLGKSGDSFCAIDLLPQSFAVFIKADEKSRSAIRKAYDLLWDKDHQLFRLFSPSYNSGLPFPGYLGGYCPGFRENGGQYTHAAVWGAMGLLESGEHEKGYEVLKGLSPFEHCERDFKSYVLEPYAMAGDVYTAKGFEGRGGWSQYTGSAGWYLTAWRCSLLGYQENAFGFSLFPRLCKNFNSFSLEINKKNTVYSVEVTCGDQYSLKLDGKDSENLFFFDGKRHNLKMVLAKKKKMV